MTMRTLACFILALTAWVCTDDSATAQWRRDGGTTYVAPAYSSYYYTTPAYVDPPVVTTTYYNGYPATYYYGYPSYYYGYPGYYSGYYYRPYYGGGLWIGGRRFGLGVGW
jgi:hypothetical protein